MRVLVTYASKHGATKGVADQLAATLREHGHTTDVATVDAVEGLDTYGAAVIGSAVYYGSWLKEAAEFVHQHRTVLAARPVWLFSVGPLGTQVHDQEQQPKELDELSTAIMARDHRLFYGALDPHALSFPERMVVKAVRAPVGDYRDWGAIAAWASDIASALPAGEATARPASVGGPAQ